MEAPTTKTMANRRSIFMTHSNVWLSVIATLFIAIISSLISLTYCQSSQLSSASQTLGRNPFLPFISDNQISDVIQKEPTYFVLASKTIRPGQVYRVWVTIYRTQLTVTVRASIQRNGVELSSAHQECKSDVPETLLLRVPPTSIPGSYRLRVEGNLNGVLGGAAFLNETDLEFSQRSMTIFVTTDKPVYMQGQTVKFRCVPITTDLRAFSDAIDVLMIDPRGYIMKRWLSRQSNLGAVSLEYPLSNLPVYGNWTIRVVAQGQVEEKKFLVEEYYQTRFEVNVSMPAFFLDTDNHVYGSVMANFTTGLPVIGNLTILATIEPAKPIGNLFNTPPAVEHTSKLFDGYYQFRFDMSSLAKLIGGSSLDGAKVSVTAYVGEPFLNLIHSGFARAFIFSSRLKLRFLGSSPQVFKPHMPYKVYVAISYHDGSPLPWDRLLQNKLQVRPRVNFHRGSSRTLSTRYETMSPVHEGIWEISINLKNELQNKRLLPDVQSLYIEAIYDDLSSVSAAAITDADLNSGTFLGTQVKADLTAYATYTPTDRLLQVDTSTKNPRVGEYIIFHVRSNYYVELFSYVIVSKGMILTTGREEMTSHIKTFAISLSPEMAPTSTIIVYDMARGGEVVADSLTFPVDGISRSNFSVTLNNRKDKTGESIEVVVLGQPGTYVGLSALDKDLYALEADNQINHMDVLRKMSSFDSSANSTLTHVWISREGKTDRFLHFPSPSYGIDANRTFELAGLIVLTDANVTRRPDNCNATRGFYSCMDGTCYHVSRKCDGRKDCRDGSDESLCMNEDADYLAYFRMHRTNRIQRMYDNSWLWKDINIGPLGYYIFSAKVPKRPATWIVSAFGLSPTHGFGVKQSDLEFSGVRPFYMNMEMPSKCILGEQIGIRVAIFNNMHHEIEVIVTLVRSPDYKFVHVEERGQVTSYSPRTSYGEHQHLVLLRPRTSSVVYMPMVATRLGEINVTVIAKTQVAKDRATKLLYVEPDGIPQYTHASVVLDLSQGAYLIKYMDTNVTESPIIPYRQERRYIFGSNRARISVVGDVVGPAFPTLPVNATSLLRQPFGCGEQNMFNFAYNMYTLLYLRLTGQRSSRVEREAFKYLNIMYQRQLSYQNWDGSFRAFRWSTRPSVWLTAFCARVLHKATFQEWENFLYIDSDVMRKAVSWILDHQTSEGSFVETHPFPYDRKMNQSSKLPQDYFYAYGAKINANPQRNISLTAHVLITLTEVRDLSGEIGSRVSTARRAAQQYLEKALHYVKNYNDPYELAIVTYALTIVNSVDAEEAFNLLDAEMKEVSGMRYWCRAKVPPPKTQIENNRPFLLPRFRNMYDASCIEATSYGLLVHVAKQAVIQKEIVDWINTQRLFDGGWASTQDTIVALEALIDYSVQSRLRDVTDIRVTIEVPSVQGLEKRVHITSKNLAKLQSFDLPNAWGAVIVKAQGSGVALVQMDVQYNVDWPHLQIAPPVKSFEVEVNAGYHGRNSSHMNVRSCQRWTLVSESLSSGMAVLEVTIPTGYFVQQQTLDSYVRSGVVRSLQEARYEERKVTFYFDHLDSTFTCVQFTAQRWYPVANLTRYIPVKVYDYYAPERFNETMVNTFNLYVLSICQVCGSYQCPYCPVYSGAFMIKPHPLVTIIATIMASAATLLIGQKMNLMINTFT